MPGDLISKKTRYEFREYFHSTTLGEIESEFGAADVPLDASHQPSTSGARRSLVEQYYHAVDFTRWRDLRTVVQGLGELRNLNGTGHGRGGRTKGLGARHARLAVGAAATLATFFFETHQERTL